MAALGPSGSRSAGGTSKQVENLLKKHLNSDSVPNSNTKWNTPPPLPTQETQLADLGFLFWWGVTCKEIGFHGAPSTYDFGVSGRRAHNF